MDHCLSAGALNDLGQNRASHVSDCSTLSTEDHALPDKMEGWS